MNPKVVASDEEIAKALKTFISTLFLFAYSLLEFII
jgi:hypothetical protein